MLSVVPFPILILILRDSAEKTVMTQAKTATAGTTASGATAATVSGVMAKIAALSVSAKIIVSIVAALVVAGAIGGAILLNDNSAQPINATESIGSESSPDSETDGPSAAAHVQ